jgi:hypothetical protein
LEISLSLLLGFCASDCLRHFLDCRISAWPPGHEIHLILEPAVEDDSDELVLHVSCVVYFFPIPVGLLNLEYFGVSPEMEVIPGI